MPENSDDPGGQRQEGEARLHRREAERLLDVDRREVEDGEHAAHHREHRQVRARQRADAEEPEAHQRRLGARSMNTNATSSAAAAAIMPIVSTEPQP